MNEHERQQRLCAKWGAKFVLVGSAQKAGIARNVFDGTLPINGLRHWPTDETSGWYIWAGAEPEQGDDYFEPVHISHLTATRPDIAQYLGLAPGWRFQAAPNHEDVWFDASLLQAIG